MNIFMPVHPISIIVIKRVQQENKAVNVRGDAFIISKYKKKLKVVCGRDNGISAIKVTLITL